MPAKASSIAEDTSSGLADSGKLPIAVSIISFTSSAVSGSSTGSAGISSSTESSGVGPIGIGKIASSPIGVGGGVITGSSAPSNKGLSGYLGLIGVVIGWYPGLPGPERGGRGWVTSSTGRVPLAGGFSTQPLPSTGVYPLLGAL